MPDPQIELLKEHAGYVSMTKADRHKNIRADFAN